MEGALFNLLKENKSKMLSNMPGSLIASRLWAASIPGFSSN
jgi:hypothetical protein